MSYTKLACLSLIEYKKILFIDADAIIVNNISHLFDLNCPAVNTATPFSFPYGPTPVPFIPINDRDDCGYIYNNVKYGFRAHNTIIPYQIMDKALHRFSSLITGDMFLLEPKKGDMEEYLAMIHESPMYGNTASGSGVDEQSLVEFYIRKKQNFTNIHYSYNFITWKAGTLNIKPNVLHYFSQPKPWNLEKCLYPDVETWFYMTKYGIQKYGIIDGYQQQTIDIVNNL